MKTGVYYKVVFSNGLICEHVEYTKKQKKAMWRRFSKWCKIFSKQYNEKTRIISVIKYIDNN